MLAAIIAAVVVVVGYVVQQGKARSDRRARTYAEAIRAVHDYLEAPYLVVRRDGSAAARIAISSSISDIQSRLRFYESLLSIQAPQHVADAFSDLVKCARTEAGGHMTEAWQRRPLRRDRHAPRGQRLEHPLSDAAMTNVLASMRTDLG
ncbi:hypothetical protein EV187_0846 [Agromyces ramosus]|uniref:Uncharacterized protein n=1 Tax=Agromyces ramosus TaxID=33879 RepID=A0A4Q7MKJ3_9MICO|nr:hypothetical protein EV187_0846 [Agromyces ramosus]